MGSVGVFLISLAVGIETAVDNWHLIATQVILLFLGFGTIICGLYLGMIYWNKYSWIEGEYKK